jgi:hypothetical protein
MKDLIYLVSPQFIEEKVKQILAMSKHCCIINNHMNRNFLLFSADIVINIIKVLALRKEGNGTALNYL